MKSQWLPVLRWIAPALGLVLLPLVAPRPAWAAPTVTITAPQNDQTVTDPTLTVEGTVSGISGTATGTVSLNGGAAQALTVSGTSFDGTVTLAGGANTIDVTITDTSTQSGSTSTAATASVTLQTAPVVTLAPPTVSGTTINFSGTISDATITEATVIYNGQDLKTIAVSGGTFASFISGACGSPTLAVTATNGAGTGTSSSATVAVGTACAGAGAGGGGGGGGSGGTGGGTSGGGAAGAAGAPSVGATGGVLASTDGSFSMTVPAGDLAAGSALTVATSLLPPSGAPAVPTGSAQASSYITLAGGPLQTPVAATITYNPAALGGLQPQRLAIFADGAWHALPTLVDAAKDAVTADVTGAETLVVLADTQRFSDVSTEYWARGAIDTLLGAGVVDGFPDGTFQPDAGLTRAEFVKMLDLTLGLPSGPGSTPFTDVSSDSWYAPYVAAAVGAGLVQGVSAASFAPGQTIDREEMAVLVARAMRLSGGSSATLTGFHDAGRVDAWASAGVEAAVAAGYLAGFPDGTLQPLGSVTRAQAAQVLATAIAHLAPQG